MIATALLLAALALILAPRVLARWGDLRRAPRAALFLWQSLALSTVLCLVTAGPIEVLRRPPWPVTGAEQLLTLAACGISAAVLTHLLANGHRIGRRLRADRQRHRDLVDLIAHHRDARLRVLPATTLGAYCVPGHEQRVVLTEATLAALPEREVDAVLAHEIAHLRERHDLVLEFFTVLHTAAPPRARADSAIDEVRLLIEVLADRAARHEVGEVALGRALVRLAGAAHPQATLGAGPVSEATTRIGLLSSADLRPWQTGGIYLAAALVLLTPAALIAAHLLATRA